jgi:hypothetical protein
MMTTTRELDVEYAGLHWRIEYYYHPPCRGRRGDFGLALEPDEPASVELVGIRLLDALRHTHDVYELLNDATVEAITERLQEAA